MRQDSWELSHDVLIAGQSLHMGLAGSVRWWCRSRGWWCIEFRGDRIHEEYNVFEHNLTKNAYFGQGSWDLEQDHFLHETEFMAIDVDGAQLVKCRDTDEILKVHHRRCLNELPRQTTDTNT